ncbi:MAG: hypothetical protein ACE5H8_02455, partial [Alphaproteobacteria bacterium]
MPALAAGQPGFLTKVTSGVACARRRPARTSPKRVAGPTVEGFDDADAPRGAAVMSRRRDLGEKSGLEQAALDLDRVAGQHRGV